MTGLSDLNFGDFSEAPQQQEQAQEEPISRSEEVKNFFKQEDEKRAALDDAHNRLSQRLDQWIGLPPPGQRQMAGYMAPQKNHIKVLLCSLHQVLWQGNTW